MINSEWLKTFSVLAETENFTRTAEQLHMTQPGVSQHIMKLEQSLGQALLLREGKSFELTPAGYEVLDYANSLIDTEGQLRERLTSDDPYSGSCRISMAPGVGNLVYDWLLDLQAEHPRLHIQIEFNPTRVVESLVLDNQCDLGLITHTPESADLKATPFLSEKLLLVLPAGVELESFEQLQDIGFIDHPDGRKMASKVLPRLFPETEIAASDIRATGFTNSAPRICHHVAKGIGYTVLDELLVKLSPEFDRLHVIDSDRLPADDISFIHKTRWPLHPRYAYVMRQLRERAELQTG